MNLLFFIFPKNGRKKPGAAAFAACTGSTASLYRYFFSASFTIAAASAAIALSAS